MKQRIPLKAMAVACVLGLMAWMTSHVQAQSRQETRGGRTQTSRTERTTPRTETPDDEGRLVLSRSGALTVREREAASRDEGRREDQERNRRGQTEEHYDQHREDAYRSDRGSYDRRGSGVRVQGKRPRVGVRPVAHVDYAWPWEYRYRYGWSPLYEYRQVLYVDAGWGRRHRETRLDVRTVYRHRVREAGHRRTILDIDIERVEIFENGRYVGTVRHIPGRLSRIQATLHRNGRMRFDRSVFIVGDSRVGFEMISTRFYDRYILDAYETSHGYRVGELDLWRERVVPTYTSRLFDPYAFDGYVPIDLLPENQEWLGDYGADAVSYYRYDDDYDDEDYFYGYGAQHHGSPYQRPGVAQSVEQPRTPRAGTTIHRAEEAPLLQQELNQEIQTERGARLKMNRTVEIRRLE